MSLVFDNDCVGEMRWDGRRRTGDYALVASRGSIGGTEAGTPRIQSLGIRLIFRFKLICERWLAYIVTCLGTLTSENDNEHCFHVYHLKCLNCQATLGTIVVRDFVES